MSRVREIAPKNSQVQKVTRISCRLFIKEIYKKDLEKIKKRLPAGANVNSIDYDGNTPLHHAVVSGNIEIVRLLIEHGANVNADNDEGFRPYNLALHLHFFEAVEVLLTDDAVITELDSAVRHLPEHIADKFYDKVDLKARNVLGRSPLHVVTMNDNVRVVRRLLARGAEPTTRSWYRGDTPLHIVVSCEMAEVLLDYGASINEHDRYAVTPLSEIALKGKKMFSRDGEQTRIIELLVDRGAEVLDVIVASELHLDYNPGFDVLHGVKDVLKYMGLREHEGSFAKKINHGEFSRFYSKVLIEVTKMKETTFYCKTSYYEFLVRSWKRQMSYVDDVRVTKVDGDVIGEIESKFPLYNAILRRHVDEARERNELRENATKAISVVCPRLQSISLVVAKILMYFSREDMKVVVMACNAL